jgi:hypothetical protein
MVGVLFCYLLMIGIGCAIPVGMRIFEKLRERKLAGILEAATASHRFRAELTRKVPCA